MKHEYRTLTAEQRKVVKLLLLAKESKLDCNYLAYAVSGKWNRIAVDFADNWEYCLALGTKDMAYDSRNTKTIHYQDFQSWFKADHFNGHDRIAYYNLYSALKPGIIYKFRAFSKKELEA